MIPKLHSETDFKATVQEYDSETHSRNEDEELTSRTLFENEEMQNGFRVYIA